MVPLANMFGYVNQLRSFTQGRATVLDAVHAITTKVPPNVADEDEGGSSLR